MPFNDHARSFAANASRIDARPTDNPTTFPEYQQPLLNLLPTKNWAKNKIYPSQIPINLSSTSNSTWHFHSLNGSSSVGTWHRYGGGSPPTKVCEVSACSLPSALRDGVEAPWTVGELQSLLRVVQNKRYGQLPPKHRARTWVAEEVRDEQGMRTRIFICESAGNTGEKSLRPLVDFEIRDGCIVVSLWYGEGYVSNCEVIEREKVLLDAS
ncbi:hypothetical protein DFP72DRAFT_1089888 [Ephemerocybe angulata]|uniref:Uncharacterized protein n=1 Tax=Ephemerocybe angulata TaxID=980116 RepID=A0A8H6MDK0_9AGAR|nr:hypothetical protein DFP72DRAFT_1089888 [Tulosesus angulatus]